jgi:hypothetical protein
MILLLHIFVQDSQKVTAVLVMSKVMLAATNKMADINNMNLPSFTPSWFLF